MTRKLKKKKYKIIMKKKKKKTLIVQLVSSLTRLELTKKENMLLFVCSEAFESILVKLETSHSVIHPPTVSVLWMRAFEKLVQNLAH